MPETLICVNVVALIVLEPVTEPPSKIDNVVSGVPPVPIVLAKEIAPVPAFNVRA